MQAINLFPLNLRCFGANCALSRITRFCAILLAQICVRAIFLRFSIPALTLQTAGFALKHFSKNVVVL